MPKILTKIVIYMSWHINISEKKGMNLMKQRVEYNKLLLIGVLFIIASCSVSIAYMQERDLSNFSVSDNISDSIKVVPNLTFTPDTNLTAVASGEIAGAHELPRVSFVLPLILFFGKTLTVAKEGGDYSSIQAAVDAASPGDIVEVHSGTYQEQVKIDKRLTLQGMDTGEGIPVIYGGDNLDITTLTLLNDGITVKGLRMTYSEKGIVIRSNNNTIESNVINDTCWAIDAWKSKGNIIRENLLEYNVDSFGIALQSCSNNSIISNTILHSRYGIDLRSSDNNTLKNNYVYDNSLNGISIRSSSNNIVEGNTVGNSVHRGIGLFNSSDNFIRNNDVSGNGWCNICIDSLCGENIVEGNTDDNLVIKDSLDVPPLKEEGRMNLNINSVPKGAEIWIEGKNTGKLTPSNIPFNKPGDYSYELRLRGYVSGKGKLNIPKSDGIRVVLKKK